MSDVDDAQGAQEAPPAAGGASLPYDEPGSGWVTFAGVMIAIAGVVNLVYGVAAIDRSSFFVEDAKFIVSDLRTWGWVLVVLGLIQLVVSLGVWARNQLARWVGVAGAGLNAIAALMLLDAHPWGAFAIFVLDLLVIYGLIAHAQREPAL